MERAIRQSAVVSPEGRIELTTPELLPGTEVEAILLVRNVGDSEGEGFIDAILLGEADVEAGRTRPAVDFFREHASRYGLSG